MKPDVCVLGSFVVDAAFRSVRLPQPGETLMGSGFALGPGGKGSNQAIAAARSGAHVALVSAVGDDTFGALGHEVWSAEGIDVTFVKTAAAATGSAAILIHETTGENAIIVFPGACSTLTATDVEAAASSIQSARVLMVQLEIPLEAVQRGLELAREAGVLTILNPAPAPLQPLPDSLLAAVDFLIPNESEAASLTGLPVSTREGVIAAAKQLRNAGARNVVMTLGQRGSLVHTADGDFVDVPAFCPGPVLDTTGAGDAFCGAFAAMLAEGRPVLAAARFASAAAGISVTRHGTAASMPHRGEVEVPSRS